MKRKNIIACLLCIGCCLCALASCKEPEANSSNNDKEVIVPIEKDEGVTLQLSTTEIPNMSIGDSQYLVAKYTEISGATIEWTSSDNGIVTVKKVDEEQCEVIANRLGSAVITAKYGAYTQTCNVTVTQNNLYPSLHLYTGVEESVNVIKGDKLDLSCFVRYNGKVFQDVSLHYAVADNTLGTVDEETRVFTATEKAGATEITITGAWREIPSELLTKTITVNVVSETVVVVNGGQLSDMELTTVAEFEGKTYQNEQAIETVEVYIDGTAVADYTMAITDNVPLDGTNNPVAVLDNNVIKANAYGSAKFTVFVGDFYSISYDITVSRPLEKYGKTIKDFSTLDGELSAEEIFKNAQGKKEIFFAYQDGYALRVTDGKVLGVQSSQTEMSVENIAVYNDKVGYTLDVECYAKLLKTEDDFKELFDTKATSAEPVTITGYFEMQNDILIDKAFTYSGNNRTFAGTFNGKGNKLTVPMRADGVFGTFAGTIKNTWFEFTHVSDKGGYGTNVLLSNFCHSGKELSNLYITIDENTFEKKETYNAISLVDVIATKTKIENVIVDYGDILPSNYSYSMYGLLAQRFDDTKDLSKYSEVYFISSTLKHLAVKTSATASYTYASNDTALKEAEAEACKTANIKQYTMSGISRYDSWSALAQGEIALSTFDELYWDTSSGVPQWKGEYVECAINGEKGIKGTLSNNANSTYKSATVSVTYKNETLPLTLTILEGSDLVSVDGATVTAKVNALGTAIVEATFRLTGEDVDRAQYFTFDVSYEIFEGEMMWSSGDEKIYLPDGLFLTDEKLTAVIDLDTQEILYANGAWDTVLLNNENRAVQVFRVGVTGDKGTLLQVQLYSYAYVITAETEIVSLFTATETKSLTGYYILANNVKVSTALGSGEKLTFAGVFDGNGYKLTVPMRDYGLFGTVTGQVKNTWFEFTNARQLDDYGRNNLLALSCASQFKIDGVVCNTLENLYITLDKTTFNKNLDGTASTKEISNFSLIRNVNSAIKMQNIIVDYADLLPTEYTKNHGLLVQYYSVPTETEYWQNVEQFTDIYFISSTLKYLSNYVTVTKVLNATNDGEVDKEGLTQYVAKDIYRYDSWTAFDGVENKDFSSFASEYWIVTNNTIRWNVK